MFDVAPTELLLVAIVALLVIGPKDLPKAMRFVGHWVGRARGVARQFRSGFDSMVREAELAELEKKWAEENARIMREHPPTETAAAQPALLPSPGEDVPDGHASAREPVFDFEDEQPAVTVERPVVEPAPESGHPAPPVDKAAS
jgi:sec-independent protein translocase protein TatB